MLITVRAYDFLSASSFYEALFTWRGAPKILEPSVGCLVSFLVIACESFKISQICER